MDTVLHLTKRYICYPELLYVPDCGAPDKKVLLWQEKIYLLSMFTNKETKLTVPVIEYRKRIWKMPYW